MKQLWRNATKTQERLYLNQKKDCDKQTEEVKVLHANNLKAGANKLLDNFKCNKTCFIQTAQRTHNLETAWNHCACQAPVEIKFSPEEVMQMMSEHNLDVNAGMTEEEIDFAAEPTTDAGASWGWMAFGTLATANAAYFAVKKN